MTRFHLSLALVALIGLPTAASAGGPEAIDEALSGIRGSWDAGLKAHANVGGAQAFRIGEDMTYHFEAAADGHLYVIHRDSHGVAQVMVPSALAEKNELSAGTPISIEDLEAVPPVGPDMLYVFVTKNPLPVDELGLAPLADDLVTYNDERSGDFASKLAAALAALPQDELASARIHYNIVGRGELEYTVGDVVAQLTPTRSVPRPKMAFHQVTFEFGKAQLTDSARRNLDVVGQALKSQALSGEKFALGGHTDDVGSSSYNQSLSLARAKAARAYLVKNWGMTLEQIEARGYGESAPAVENTDDDQRAVNRRVELEVLR